MSVQIRRKTAIVALLCLTAVAFVGPVAAQSAEITDITQPEPGGEFQMEYEVSGGSTHQVEVSPPSGAEVNFTDYSGGFNNLGSGDDNSASNPNGVALLDTFDGDGSFTATLNLTGGADGDSIEVDVKLLNFNNDTVATATGNTTVSENGGSGGSSGGSDSTYILPPDPVSPDGEFSVEYVVGTGDSHEFEINPNGFEVNITGYNGSTSFSNLENSPEQTDSRTNSGSALFSNFVGAGSYELTVDVIGGSAGDDATMEVRAFDGNNVAESNTTQISISDQHPSGVSQSLFDAVAGLNGDPSIIERPDVVDSISAYFGSDEVDGVEINRTDVVDLIDWYFTQ